MEKEFDIELEQVPEQQEEGGNVQLPLNFLSFGEIEADDVKVYIKQGVYKALEAYAAEDTSTERGTILIGDYCEELGKTHVVISDYIEARYTDASASTLTFTHETWDYVHKQHSEHFPQKKIIGWQHTHPNYGIFLSNYDLFIQENFFNLPFQIAYVIDPIQNLRGFFQWKGGKIEKLKGYYVYDEVGKPIKIEQKKVETAATRAPSKGHPLIITLLCLLTVGLGILSLALGGKYRAQLKEQQALAIALQQQIDDQAGQITDLQDRWVQSVLDPTNAATVDEMIRKIQAGELKVENKEEVLLQLNTIADSFTEGDKAVRFVAYTVKEGDCLSVICKEHNLDYEANKSILMAVNGLTDADIIRTGQTLLLPIQ